MLTTPEVLPENEGKLVIIKGRYKLTKAVHDKDYNENFPSPSVSREIEKSVGSTRGGEEWMRESYTVFTGGAKMGNFVLSSGIIENIPRDSSRVFRLGNGKRITYHYTPGSYQSLYFTIIGTQKGHSIVSDKRIKLGSVFQGKYNKRQILDKSLEEGKSYRTLAAAFFACSLIIGAASWLFFAAQIKKIYT
ncbi:hypothetical protein IJT93_07635 [bacterium]|nr:hypothetical protein [bacterium]